MSVYTRHFAVDLLAASLGYALAIGASRGAGDGEEEEEEEDDDDDDDDGPAAVTSAPSSHRAASRGDADAAARAAAAAAATAPHRAEGFILTSASRREGDRRRRRPRCRVCVLAVVASDETKVRRRLRPAPKLGVVLFRRVRGGSTESRQPVNRGVATPPRSPRVGPFDDGSTSATRRRARRLV
eukprot:9840-Pelagococcus_subviridis.AAC.2